MCCAQFKWWAQYLESNGHFDDALQYYERAEDWLAIVRVLCFRQQLDKASDIINETGDPAAAYHLARQYEAGGYIKEAIHFFQRAQRFNHAVRLAKAHEMPSELNMLALQVWCPGRGGAAAAAAAAAAAWWRGAGWRCPLHHHPFLCTPQAPARIQIEAAEYLEARGMPEKAVLLFQKGGNLSRAVELCFRSRLFDALREIADALTAETDPQLLQSCAEFFLDHGQYAKTVHLFAVAGEYTKALDLCVLHNIELTEDTAEQLCPPLGAPGAETADARNAVLSKIAKCCKRQGNFHLACKKYTQAGDKLKAMKCLLKSGDTQKICYFAGVSRTREIYILAANYLQSLDWHSDAGVMKNIVAFYTKAKAMEQLASFYDACAQVEIDEYRDYEKALGALKEAHEYMTKARVQGREDKLASLQQRIVHVEAFVNARKMVKSSPEQMVAMCHDLLEQADIESAIRVGDVRPRARHAPWPTLLNRNPLRGCSAGVCTHGGVVLLAAARARGAQAH